MKIVGPIERIDRTFPGWDNKNHGIHSAERHLVVRAEIEDGRRVALSLTIVTGEYPETVPLASRWSMRGYPNATDLSLHVQVPRGSAGDACTWFGSDGGRCYIESTTSLGADRLFNAAAGNDDAIWAALEQKLVEGVTAMEAPTRHVAFIASDPESLRRGGSTRVAVCSCGWRGPERATLEMVADDALEHEKASPS